MKKLLTILLLFLACMANAQMILTLDDALKIALEKNYDISVARNEGLIARTNNTPGKAGMLPDISLNAYDTYNIKRTSTRESKAAPFSTTSASSETQGANIALNWTVFDGGKMFITKSRLAELEGLGEVRFREQVLQTMSGVITAYFNVVKLKQQLVSLEQTIAYNQERLKIAETGFNSGAKMKSDFLQAKIDLNVNLENRVSQKMQILAAKRALANMLSMQSDSLFEVVDTIAVDYKPDKAQLESRLYKANSSIRAFERQLNVQKLVLKESYRSQLPRLDVTGGYYFVRNLGTNEVQTLYPQVNINFNLPIFQSGDLHRQVVISKLGVETAQFNLESAKLEVNTELQNALTNFEEQQKMLVIEEENYQLAKENIEISLQRMKLGEATSLEVRMSQTDFEQSATRLTNFKYNLKVAETTLKQLMGDL